MKRLKKIKHTTYIQNSNIFVIERCFGSHDLH